MDNFMSFFYPKPIDVIWLGDKFIYNFKILMKYYYFECFFMLLINIIFNGILIKRYKNVVCGDKNDG